MQNPEQWRRRIIIDNDRRTMTMIPRTPPRIARGASAILSKAKGSFSSPSGRRAGAVGGSSTSTSRESNNKSPAVSFANDENHATTNGTTTGGDAREIVGDAPVHSGTTLENYVLPRSLRMDVLDVSANGGMEVIKVSKVCRCFAIVVGTMPDTPTIVNN